MKKFDNGYLWKNVKDTETHKFVCQAQPEPSSYKEDDIWYWFKSTISSFNFQNFIKLIFFHCNFKKSVVLSLVRF